MKRKIFWIASGILLLILLVLQVTFHSNYLNFFGVLLDSFGTSITYGIFGATPASLLSLIPYKNWPFGKKFEALFPVTLFFVLLIYAIVSGFMEYQTHFNGIKFHPLI